MTILAQVVDPDGRRVELTVERWDHIVDDHDGHPELDAYLADVMLAVSEPHEQRPGHRDNELWISVGTSVPAVAAGGRSLGGGARLDRYRIRPPQRPMTVQIGNLAFDRVRYDADGDALYLHRGDPSDAADFDASPEGHALRFDPKGDLVGVTILSVRWLLDHDGEITLTIPTPEKLHLAPEQLSEALAVA